MSIAMDLLRSEHTMRSDSQRPFTDKTYAITTTSELEFWFVVDPEGMLPVLATRQSLQCAATY